MAANRRPRPLAPPPHGPAPASLRWSTALPLFALALAGAAAGCSAPVGASPAPPALSAVEVERVTRGTVAQRIEVQAELRPAAQVQISAPFAERVVAVKVDEGDTVRAGQVLVTLRRDSLRHSLAQQDAQAEVLAVQTAQLERDLARLRELRAGQLATGQSVEQLEATLAANRAQAKVLRASRAQLAQNLAEADLKAPLSGVVTARRVEPGDLVGPQTPLLTLMALERIEVDLRLAERDAVQVTVGQPVELRLDAYPAETFVAQVERVAPVADVATRTVSVQAALANPPAPDGRSGRLRPGMYARAELRLDERADALLVPLLALELDDALAPPAAGGLPRRVFVVGPEDRVELRALRVGRAAGERAEVIEGLAEGERVVVRGRRGLKDGQRVQLQGQGSLARVER